jgi:protein involved in polysaccharide export with SLBB domain
LAETRDFATTWVEFDMIQIGGGYAYQIGIIEDNTTHARKVRVAKGRLTVLPDGRAAVKQAQKLNLKSKEWPQLRQAIEKYLEKLPATGQDDDETTDEQD